jgi:hypothetical protein
MRRYYTNSHEFLCLIDLPNHRMLGLEYNPISNVVSPVVMDYFAICEHNVSHDRPWWYTEENLNHAMQ